MRRLNGPSRRHSLLMDHDVRTDLYRRTSERHEANGRTHPPSTLTGTKHLLSQIHRLPPAVEEMIENR